MVAGVGAEMAVGIGVTAVGGGVACSCDCEVAGVDSLLVRCFLLGCDDVLFLR